MPPPALKRKQQGSCDGDVERPQYVSSYRSDFEQRQPAGTKRRRLDLIEDGTAPSFDSHMEHARLAFDSRLEPESVFEAGARDFVSRPQGDPAFGRQSFGSRVRIQRPQLQNDFTSASPSFGSRRRLEDVHEGGVPDHGFGFQGDSPSARSSFGSRHRPKGKQEDRVPHYESGHQRNFGFASLPFGYSDRQEDISQGSWPLYGFRTEADLAAAPMSINTQLTQRRPFEGGTQPSFRSSFADFRGSGAPEGVSRVQGEFAFPGQAFSFEPRQSMPASNEHNSFEPPGEMIGPLKRKVQAPPNQPSSQLAFPGAAQIEPLANANTDGDKRKKHAVEEVCAAIFPMMKGFVELRCDKCHCNTSATTGKFWGGIRGFQTHFQSVHKESPRPTEIISRCGVRWLSADEVEKIITGELVIEKLSTRVPKEDKRNK